MFEVLLPIAIIIALFFFAKACLPWLTCALTAKDTDKDYLPTSEFRALLPRSPISDIFVRLYDLEPKPDLPPVPSFRLYMPEHEVHKFAADQAWALARLEEADTIVETFKALCFRAQQAYNRLSLEESYGPFRVPVRQGLPNFNYAINELFWLFFDKSVSGFKALEDVQKVLRDNANAVAAAFLSKQDVEKGLWLEPKDFHGSSIVERYLGGTPFADLFSGELPFGWKDSSTRFEHTWIIAPPKSGKTQLLQAMIADDLTKVESNEASIVVIDSQGPMLDVLKNLQLFDRIPLTVIDPAHDIAINPFSISTNSEQDLTNTIFLLTYIIGSLLDAPMTAKQTGMFRWVVMGLLQTPDATLRTLMNVLRGEKLNTKAFDADTKDYFDNSFYRDSSLKETKDQVAWRIDTLLSHPPMRRMLSEPRTDLDFNRALQNPCVTLIHTNKELLSDNGAEFFGRYCIAMLLRASQARRGGGLPSYIYIDECQDYIANDPNIPILRPSEKAEYRLNSGTSAARAIRCECL